MQQIVAQAEQVPKSEWMQNLASFNFLYFCLLEKSALENWKFATWYTENMTLHLTKLFKHAALKKVFRN